MRFSLLLSFVLFCLIAYSQTTDKYPIFNEKPKKGIYVTFEEFKFNEPSITDGFSIKHKTRTTSNWKDTKSYYIKKDSGSKINIPDEVWGFSNGNEIFIFHIVEFFKLSRQNDGFISYAYRRANLDTSKAEEVGSIVGSLFGGQEQIAGAPKSSVFGNVVGEGAGRITKKTRIKKVLNTKLRYCLDFDGKLKHTPAETNFFDLNKHRHKEKRTITIIRGKAKELNQNINIDFDDRTFEIPPNSLKEIEVTFEDKIYSICLNNNKKDCFKVNLINDKPYFFQISYSKKKGYDIKIPTVALVKNSLKRAKKNVKH